MMRIIYFILLFTLALQPVAAQSLHWQQSSIPLSHGITSLLAAGDTIFAGSSGEGIFRSTDDGGTWKQYILPGVQGMVTSLIQSGSIFFASVNDLDSGGVYRSTDCGNSWNRSSLVTNSIIHYGDMYVNTLAANNAAIYAGSGVSGGNGFIYQSEDSGKSWQQIFAAINYSYISVMAALENTLIASVVYQYSGTLYRSRDNGYSWGIADSGMPGSGGFPGNAITVLGSTSTSLFAGGGWTEGIPGIYRSIDLGGSWAEADTGITLYFGHKSAISAFGSIGNLIFTSDGTGAYLSNDNGLSWIAENDGLTTANITSLAANKKKVFAGTSGSDIFIADISQLSNFVPPNVTETQMIGNYPNPFSGKTEIRFKTMQRSSTGVTVINILGEEVAKLFSGVFEAGEHSLTWYAEGQPPGLYQCLVQLADRTLRLPIVLMR